MNTADGMAAAAPAATGLGKRRTQLIHRIVAYGVLGIGSLFILAPLVWMLSTSLKTRSQVFRFPPEWIPEQFLWRNYVEALTLLPFEIFLLNTAIITALSVVGELVSSAVVAYAFARLRWAARNTLFIVVLATMMLPRQVTLIPTFILFTRVFGWKDTFYPLIVPSFFAVPFFVFLLRQFYMTLPFELDDAATIDGCSKFGVFLRILLPLSKPALAAVANLLVSVPLERLLLSAHLPLRQGQVHAGPGPPVLPGQLWHRLALPHGRVAGGDAAGDPGLLLCPAHLYSGGCVPGVQVIPGASGP